MKSGLAGYGYHGTGANIQRLRPLHDRLLAKLQNSASAVVIPDAAKA